MSVAVPHDREKPLRFLIAGALNTLVGLSFYPMLMWGVPGLHKHYMLALLIAQVLCLCFAFATYKVGVFRTHGNLAREFRNFSTYYLFNYAANWVALPLLVEFADLSPILAQFGFTLILIGGSWLWHSRVTFR
jgi:putative flippase GtrA